MNGSPLTTARKLTLGLALGGAVALGTSGCGGAGGASSGQTLVGLVLVNFVQAGEDNLPLNRVLQFDFSSAIDPDTIDFSSIQLRQGPAFGLSVPGKYIVQGSQVFFQPKLPGSCLLTDGGFQPNTDYRVTLLGAPEEFAIRNLAHAPLVATVSGSFHTRIDTDPELFEDALPGSGPTVVQTSPIDGAYPDGPVVVFPTIANPADSNFPEVYIGPTIQNKVVIDFSENLDPCTVTENTVRFYQYGVGNQPTFPDGFLPGPDVTPGDPFSWGSGTPTSPPRRVRANYVLQQGFLSTRLTITPQFTNALGNPEFPDNALLVVEVTNNVKDFGQTALIPKSFAFVTENRYTQNSSRVFDFLGETPIDTNATTADVNTSRSVSKAQGFVLFAGDGDNGLVLTRASNPDTSAGPVGCTTPAGIPQVNDGFLDDFDPLADTTLDTGSTVNKCKNTTDGSTAVVFEFRSFHIRNNVTVRVLGANPAIILVQGDVSIESNGTLLVRGDNQGGSPNSQGASGAKSSTSSAAGGTGVAGGGRGGDCIAPGTGLSQSGTTGYYNSPPGTVAADVGTVGGAGAGHGNISAYWSTQANPDNKNSTGGGGAGHAQAGVTGQNTGTGTTPLSLDGAADGFGGSTYGDVTGKMLTPEAGSGGGGAGTLRTIYGGTTGQGPGGGGGAGGGFVDLTAKGNIFVLGKIDAAGGRGGPGAAGTVYSWEPGTGGGGGGSGGGIRLLTPKSITFGANTLVTAQGGAGGTGGIAQASPAATQNDGGAGGAGRIVLEDSDSVISGYIAGATIPADGSPVGFYRGLFDATRFQGGGLTPQVVTGLIDVGPTQPTFFPPVQNYGTQEDFIVNVPLVSTRGFNAPSMFFEIQGFPANPDGTANLLAGTGWKSVGYFKDSSSAAFPTWVAGTPAVGNIPTALPDGQVPSLPQGNTGGTIASVNLNEFIKFRVTFYLKTGTGAFDEGPSVDRWTLNFSYNQ